MTDSYRVKIDVCVNGKREVLLCGRAGHNKGRRAMVCEGFSSVTGILGFRVRPQNSNYNRKFKRLYVYVFKLILNKYVPGAGIPPGCTTAAVITACCTAFQQDPSRPR